MTRDTPQRDRVMELLLRGLTNKELANELNIAEATVKVHVKALMHQRDVTNRTALVLRALGYDTGALSKNIPITAWSELPP